jgi:hypothetical protein
MLLSLAYFAVRRLLRLLTAGCDRDHVERHLERILREYVRHYRGRDGHRWPPPAQIPACASNALGS